MEISNLKVKDTNKITVDDSLKAPILKLKVSLTKNTVIPNNNNLIIYVKQNDIVKEYSFTMSNPLAYANNLSDEFIISPSFNGEKVELTSYINRKINSTTKESLNYKPIILFEGTNEIYTNYQNAIIEISYPKDTEIVYYFLSNMMANRTLGTSSFDIDMVYPVGSIYMSVSNEDPSTLFGGTWESFASGRTLIGIDVTQQEFNEPLKTGGEKNHTLTIDEMPSHKHIFKGLPNFGTPITWGTTDEGISYAYTNETVYERATAILYAGGDQPHNNLPPYITVYMWRRIA